MLASILNNPRDVRFADACKAAEALGFRPRQSGTSHRFYARAGDVDILNFQDRGGRLSPYQARQLCEMIKKYGEGHED